MTLSNQKLLTNLFIGLASIPRSFDNFENTNMVITWYDTVTDKLQALLESYNSQDSKFMQFPCGINHSKVSGTYESAGEALNCILLGT